MRIKVLINNNYKYMLFSQNQRYNDVIPQGTAANATSIPIFCADFSKIEFTLEVNGSANFNIGAYISNQENPPDPTLSESTTNLYSKVAYQDVGTQTIYLNASLYNPTAPGSTTVKTFVVEVTAARWFFLQISGYSAGALLKADVDVFTGN